MTNPFGLSTASCPHIHSHQHTRQIMTDVIIALTPTLLAAIWLLSTRVLLITVASVSSCVAFEWIYIKAMRRNSTIGDCSAMVTGTILALSLRSDSPLWMVFVGSFISIIIMKNLFGGLGNNYLNPALSSTLAVVRISAIITPAADFQAASAIDAISAATPLAQMKAGYLPNATIFDMLLQKTGGAIGEVSSLMLLLGGVYLIWRGVIKLRIPVAFILTVALLSLTLSNGHNPLLWMLYSLLGGGLLFASIFIATDYSSSPVTEKGQWLYGIGCGALTVLFRQLGSGAEGITYAILIMNALARSLDLYCAPRRYGV